MDIQAWLSSQLINPAHRFALRPQVHHAVQQVKAHLALNQKQCHNYQLERLRKLCKIAARSDYYCELFKQAGLTDFEKLSFEQYHELPLLSKDTVRDQAEALTPKGINQQDLRRSATGGTTDSPISIYMDWPCYYKRLASTIVHDSWLGYSPGLKMAYLWGASQDFPDKMGIKLQLQQLLFGKKLFLQSGYLNDETMHAHYLKLKSFKPILLQAYPTPLTIFAKFLLQHKLNLPIKNISCTAEPLLEYQSQLIEEAFGTQPFNWYGSRECGRIATETANRSGLRINSYNLYIEQLHNFNERGNIIITDLWNEGFPMLRYDTRDIGLLKKTHNEGFGTEQLNSLDGRTTDIFVSSNGTYVPGVAFTNRLIKDNKQFLSLQIFQNDYQDFHIKVVPGMEYCSQSNDLLTSVISGFMGENINLTTEVVDKIMPERSGKVRFCICNIKT